MGEFRDAAQARASGAELLTAWLSAAIVLAFIALTVWGIDTDRRQTLDDAEGTAGLAAAALAQHSVETFSEALAPMSSMAGLMAQAGGADKVSAEQAHIWLKALTPPGTPVDRLVLFDMSGQMYATTVRANPPFADTYAKHPLVLPHIEGSAGDRLIIGMPLELPPESILMRPMLQPGSSRWIIPLTRTISAPDGRPAAIMGALLRVDYFDQFYGILGDHRDASIALLHEDGSLLARHPFRPEYEGVKFVDTLRQREAEATTIGRSPVDQVERLYVVKKVGDLPLRIVVGLSMESIMEPWRLRTIQRAVISACFCVIIVCFSILLIRGFRRRGLAERALQSLNIELERRVRERTAELTRANEDLQAFSYSASHDLRAPIRRIAGFADAIVHDHDTALPADARRMLDRIRASAHQTDGLLDDLLGLFKVNQTKLHPVALDIGLMARSVMDQIAADDPERKYRVEIQEGGMGAMGDEGLVRVALINLMANAWKYSAKVSEAHIAVGRSGEEFFVRDNGAGFEMAHAGKLFRAFSRLHSASEFAGTGIGLAIVARVIERHGGQVRAEGQPNQGATFYFSLPG